jgi:sugar/nucleoside kinase (ribokinase family)
VLLVDHFGIGGMLRAARIARDAGVAVVADFEVNGLPDCIELLPLIDHLIVSLSFARTVTGETTPAKAVAKLWCDGRQAVVLTDGAAGCWHVTSSEPRQVCHQPSFSVDVADTTGCGDVFHGAYAAALVEGLAPADGILFASAAAALKAAQPGGQAGIPTRSVLENFLQRQAP